MSTKLSPEAARAKYQYNKKYQQAYWERRAAKEKAIAEQEATKLEDAAAATLDTVSVPRRGMTDQRYIAALETSNKTLNSENRRLVRLVTRYQQIIGQSKLATL